MDKVVFLKLLPSSFIPESAIHASKCRDGGAGVTFTGDLLDSRTRGKSAVIVKRTGGYFSIQGYAPVPYREKHRCCSIFRTAVRDLLGIADGIPISLRFADPPFAAVSEVSTILQEPSHVVNLIVSPLERGDSVAEAPHLRMRRSESCRRDIDFDDPLCKLAKHQRELRSTPGSEGFDACDGEGMIRARQKCSPVEMARLLEALSEVNVSLQRTQEQCDAIEERCSRNEEGKQRRQRQRLSKLGRSRVMTFEVVDEAAKEEKEEEGSGSGEAAGNPSASCDERDFTADSHIEKLLHLASTLTQNMLRQQKSTLLHAELSPDDEGVQAGGGDGRGGDGRGVPDCPSEVCARSDFGNGVYVMWHPVRLDASDTNRGCNVVGYEVFLDGEPKAMVEGALSSQLSLAGLEEGRQYVVQVCTLAEKCKSSLSLPVSYRYEGSTRLHRSHPGVDETDDGSVWPSSSARATLLAKTAKVESWLNGSTSLITADSGHREGSPSSSPTNGYGSHVHFAENPSVDTRLTYAHLGRGGGGVEELDAKSVASSHTSGIVTDCPASPKFSPVSPYHRCDSSRLLFASPLTSRAEMTGSSRDTPSNECTPSTIRHQLGHSPAASSFSMVDTVINEPVALTPPPHPLLECWAAAEQSRKESKEESRVPVQQWIGGRKGPATPQNVVVVTNRSGLLCVSWTPVRRDSKGCSNGHFVLGYRIYVNGMSKLSVDGPTSFEAVFKYERDSDTYHSIMIHVRTRSIAGESSPSKYVLHDTRLPVRRRAKIDSAISSTNSSASLFRNDSFRSQSTSSAGGGRPQRSHPLRSVMRLETAV